MKAKRSQKSGKPPGTLLHIGEQKTDKVKVRLVHYSQEVFEEKEIQDLGEISAYRQLPGKTWINVDGLHDVGFIEQIGALFEIHPLVLEDILNTTQQRPKREDWDKYLFLELKVPVAQKKAVMVGGEQACLIFGDNWLLSFFERPSALVDQVRERLTRNKSRARSYGIDYLGYILLDAIVDSYFAIFEELGEELEDLEERVLIDADPKIVREIHSFRRTLLNLRRVIWPLREVVGGLDKGESELIKPQTGVYIRDVYDHIVQMIDVVESYRDMVSSILEIYLSSTNNRLSAVMKTLTIIATIFMPITFISSLYGMNFEFMPELKWQYGYPLALSLMLVISLFMVRHFRRKKWI